MLWAVCSEENPEASIYLRSRDFLIKGCPNRQFQMLLEEQIYNSHIDCLRLAKRTIYLARVLVKGEGFNRAGKKGDGDSSESSEGTTEPNWGTLRTPSLTTYYPKVDN